MSYYKDLIGQRDIQEWAKNKMYRTTLPLISDILISAIDDNNNALMGHIKELKKEMEELSLRLNKLEIKYG